MIQSLIISSIGLCLIALLLVLCLRSDPRAAVRSALISCWMMVLSPILIWIFYFLDMGLRVDPVLRKALSEEGNGVHLGKDQLDHISNEATHMLIDSLTQVPESAAMTNELLLLGVITLGMITYKVYILWYSLRCLANQTVAELTTEFMDRTYRVILIKSELTPFVIGIFNPKIVISEKLWNSCSEDEMRAILAHESAHLENGDHRSAWFLHFAKGLYFWNPLFFWIARQMMELQEYAADQAASLCFKDRQTYPEVLLKLIKRQTLVPYRKKFALGIAGSGSFINKRIKHLYKGDNMSILSKKKWIGITTFAIIMGTGLLFAVTPKQKKDYTKINYQMIKNIFDGSESNQKMFRNKLSKYFFDRYQKNYLNLGDSRKGQGIAFIRTNKNKYGVIYYTWKDHYVIVKEAFIYKSPSEKRVILKDEALPYAGHRDLDQEVYNPSWDDGYRPDIHVGSWNGIDDRRAYLQATDGATLLFPVKAFDGNQSKNIKERKL